MGDTPTAAVFCGEMCNGCKDDCAACATVACGDCGGCNHGRELAQRARVAGAALTLLQIGGPVPLEFGFNPNQLRGPDGRFIKMGGRGSAGKGGLPKGSGLKNPRVDADGRPRVSEGGGAGAGGSDASAESPGRAIAKRKYSDGDRVPLADGSTGTVVGGHHLVGGRPGMYVTVRPDDGGKLKEVAVDAIRKRQIREAEANPTSAELVERGNAADQRRREAAERRRKPTAEELGIGQRLPEPAAALSTPDTGPPPVGFTPRSDKDWNLTQKRLGKRTPRTDLDGEFQPGDIVPAKDGKWAEVLGDDPSLFWERNGLKGIKVRDDAKGYVHGESAADIKKRIEQYAAEKAWRDGGGSSDRLAGAATAPVNAQGLRPGEPPIGEDGKYAKPTKQYAVHNGQVYTRTSRNPYRYASVVSFRDPSHPGAEGRHDKVWSWHRTAEAAAKGTLTGDQRRGLYVSKVIETSFEPPADSGPATPAAPRPATRAEIDGYNRQIETTARAVRDQAVDEGPESGGMSRYKERELSDRLQELADARDAGQSDKVDRITAQIRKILLDTQTGGALPPVPNRG